MYLSEWFGSALLKLLLNMTGLSWQHKYGKEEEKM